MTPNQRLSSRPFRKTRYQPLRTLRAVSASFLLTMRLFDLLPEDDLRPPTAIVRELTRNGAFDPLELLPNGVVLTMPFNVTSPQAIRQLIEIGPN
jgi:hypothetical protein